MGAAKTKTVGGGSATPVANQWNEFLSNGLKTGSFNPATGGASSATGVPTTAQAQQNGMGATIDQLLKGQGPQFGEAPTLQTANYNPNQTNLDLSKYNYNPNTMDLQTLLNSGFKMGTGAGGFGGGGAGAGYAGTQATGVPDFLNNQTQLGKVDMNDPAFAALAQKLKQDTALGLANSRERFGGNALNSGASLAEAQFNAQANPANVLAMQQLQAQMRGLNLADYQAIEQATQGRLGLASNSQIGNRQISSNESIANAGNATSASIANANLGAQYAQMGLQGQGQILDYLLGAGNLGLNAANSGAQNAYNAFNANNTANQNNNINAYNNANMANNFNQNIYGQQSQNILGGFNAGQQGQLNALNQLFGSFGQSNALGTPQAQTVQVQNPWIQGIQGIAGIAQGVGGIMQGAGNIFGNNNNGSGFGMNTGTSRIPSSIPQQGGFIPTSQWPTQSLPTSVPSSWGPTSTRWTPGLMAPETSAPTEGFSPYSGQQQGYQQNPFIQQFNQLPYQQNPQMMGYNPQQSQNNMLAMLQQNPQLIQQLMMSMK